ncbi:MAG: SMP-30/gluconolactonase/LRE family protein [bacterium]|nr:SMP-30/gluconolactonase/LRE family protein [bacterium]
MYRSHKPSISLRAGALLIAATTLAVATAAVAHEADWGALNAELVGQHGIKERSLAYQTETGILSNLTDGVVTPASEAVTIDMAPGVTGRMYWGRGNLVNTVSMDPRAEIPRETSPGERIMIMLEGSLEQWIDGVWVPMERTAIEPTFYFSTGVVGRQDALYLEAGAQSAVRAGADGAQFIEFYGPVRLDYLQKAGVTVPGSVGPPALNGTPNMTPNQVFDLQQIQYTMLVPGAWTRILNGRGMQISNIFMEPDIEFGYHNHPEEQLMIVQRGGIREFILDGQHDMVTGDMLFLPAMLIHGGKLSPEACHAIDVFYPTRADYSALMGAQQARFHRIIPPNEKPKLLAEGFHFTEGPAWMNGKLYFSSMFFDIPAGTWKADVSKSDLIAMTPDGAWEYVLKGKMQTNGLMPKGNGNLVAMDMAGHRVVELSPRGKVIKVLADRLGDPMGDGIRLDGPNDLVIDARGGIYFTDPQFISDTPARPGKTVNYITPKGEVIEIIPPGQFGMPNGVLLSPDGKTLYVNNTYHDARHMSDAENWIIAYDVNADGTVANKRRFAQLFLPPGEYELGTRSSCADGMTIDTEGNIYVATNVGLQIFGPAGEYIGIVRTPTFPVSCTFGGEQLDTIYMTAWDKVYSIKTNMRGLEYPLHNPAN